MSTKQNKRKFLKGSAYLLGATVLGAFIPKGIIRKPLKSSTVPVSGHVWVYASKFPPNWDCTPILDQVFADFEFAGMEGVELMESNLRRTDIIARLQPLMKKHRIPVTGTSYNAPMWDRTKHAEIKEDVEVVLSRLHILGGCTFGITVGDAGRIKTEGELDAQAELLTWIIKTCSSYNIQPNLHNHTFEVENDMHDLKGILERIPDMPLGPDINWLIRGGVDPVRFIETYGKQLVYLHLRDQNSEGKWTKALGEGITDFPGIAEALKKVKFKGRAAVELAFEKAPENGVRQDWKKSRDYVREVFEW